MSAPARDQHANEGPLLYAPRRLRPPPSAAIERTHITTTPSIASAPPVAGAPPINSALPTAPEIGSVRAAVPALPRARPFEGDVAIKDLRSRLSRNPDLALQPPAQTGPAAVAHWIGGWSFASIMAAIAFGTMLLTFYQPGDAGRLVSPPSQNFSNAATSTGPAGPARLQITSQKGFVNEPLALGLSLDDLSGNETVMLAGFAAGTTISAGTSLSPTRWQLSAQEIAGALAYAPKDFIGVMAVGVDLHSAGDQLLESQIVRLEWILRNEDRSAAAPDSSRPAELIGLLDPDGRAVLEHFLKNGDILSARILLRRAAGGGNAQAALELGMTFDPLFLAERGVRGFAPDVAEARAWYERAMVLGSSQASRNLERLTSMKK
jgi:hypothetical protein